MDSIVVNGTTDEEIAALRPDRVSGEKAATLAAVTAWPAGASARRAELQRRVRSLVRSQS